MIELRRAGPDDAGDLARLRAASLSEQGYLTPSQREPFARRAAGDFARLLAERRLVAWLLCADGAIVGSACATYFERLPFPDGTLHAELSGVYVAPGFRGAGRATRLISAVVDEIRSSPARKTVLRPSPAARSLYERLGFVDDATGVMSLA
jgi:GNAT superfamily N-acetyltransferase